MASKQTSKGTFPNEAWQVPGEVPPAGAKQRPLTNTAPGSPDYALSGPLAAKIPPERPKQGEGSL
jgi:hypothetical protein